MKILTMSHEYPPVGGGGATFCQVASEAFVRAGHRVDVVTSKMSDLASYEERNGVFIHRVPCVRRHRYYSTAPELATQLVPAYLKARELLGRYAHDLTHCHFIVPSGAVSFRLWKRYGVPYVLTAHGSDVPGYNPDRFAVLHGLMRPFWRGIVRSAAAVTTPSEFLAELLRRQVDVPIDVIPYGFDAPPLPEGPRDNVILVVTRMVERKGVQHLIEALEKMGTSWRILIAGDGPYLPTLKKLAAARNVPAEFLGFVPREELAVLYRTAKVFVFPSIQENFPLVLLEAMAAGCAVVTTSAPGCAEVVGDAAVKVDPGSVGQLCDALTKLLTNEQELADLGRRARERVELFAWPRVIPRYEAVFQRSLH